MNGQDLYKVYGQAVDFKNYQGKPMPDWVDLPDPIKNAWEAVALAKNDQPILETRELARVHHALEYEDHHQFAGIPGHGHFLLIAKLAKALGYIYD